MRKQRGLFFGVSTVDFIFGFDRYPVEDTKNTANRYTISAGGPASNAAVAFSYLGGDAQLVSSLGKSGIADIARCDLTQHGVRHLDLTENRESDPALSAIAIAGNNGSRTILTSPAIDDDYGGTFDEGRISQIVFESDIVLLDGHQISRAVSVARLAKSEGITVIMDGDIYKPQIDGLLEFVDIVIFGKNFSIPGKRSNLDLFEFFENIGIRHVVATNAEKPIEFVSDGCPGTIDVEAVSVIDTLGAGDIFHGAFCYFYSKCGDFQKALRHSSRVASASVSKFGTREWMNDFEPSDFE